MPWIVWLQRFFFTEEEKTLYNDIAKGDKDLNSVDEYVDNLILKVEKKKNLKYLPTKNKISKIHWRIILKIINYHQGVENSLYRVTWTLFCWSKNKVFFFLLYCIYLKNVIIKSRKQTSQQKTPLIALSGGFSYTFATRSLIKTQWVLKLTQLATEQVPAQLENKQAKNTSFRQAWKL